MSIHYHTKFTILTGLLKLQVYDRFLDNLMGPRIANTCTVSKQNCTQMSFLRPREILGLYDLYIIGKYQTVFSIPTYKNIPIPKHFKQDLSQGQDSLPDSALPIT